MRLCACSRGGQQGDKGEEGGVQSGQAVPHAWVRLLAVLGPLAWGLQQSPNIRCTSSPGRPARASEPPSDGLDAEL